MVLVSVKVCHPRGEGVFVVFDESGGDRRLRRCLQSRQSRLRRSFGDFNAIRRRKQQQHQNAIIDKIDRMSVASVSRSWTSRTSVSVPLRDLDPSEEGDNYSRRSFSEYISDGSRILAVTFPDETRREQLTDTTWKVQVLCVECVVGFFRVFVDERLEKHLVEANARKINSPAALFSLSLPLSLSTIINIRTILTTRARSRIRIMCIYI